MNTWIDAQGSNGFPFMNANSATEGVYLEIHSTGIYCRINQVGSTQLTSTNYTGSGLIMVTLKRDGTTVTLYINGSSVGNYTNSGDCDSTRYTFGKTEYNGLYHSQTNDEVGFWKGKALSVAEIEELYNSGDGLAYPFGASSGWAGKIQGISPGKVNSIAKADISKIQGVE